MLDELTPADDNVEDASPETSDTGEASEATGATEVPGGEEESVSDGVAESSDEVETGDEATDATDAADDDDDDDSNVEVAGDGAPRRTFLTQVLAGTVGAVVGLVPVLSGLVFFLDPLLRDDSGGGEGAEGGGNRDADGFVKLAVSRSALKPGGAPQQVTVVDDLVDAWNKFPNVPIGSVWLHRTDGGDVVAFNTVCPHLGCAVEYRNVQNDFYCPCHLSAFKLDGTKNNPIPPRDMDSLEVKADTGDEIWVQFKNFRGAIAEKVEV